MQHPLEAFRKSNGDTQAQLAEKLRVAQSTYNSWVQAQRYPTAANMDLIEKVTSVSASQMWVSYQRIRKARVGTA